MRSQHTTPPLTLPSFAVPCAQGAMGFVFSDFGPKFTVRDVTGENPVTRSVRQRLAVLNQ